MNQNSAYPHPERPPSYNSSSSWKTQEPPPDYVQQPTVVSERTVLLTPQVGPNPTLLTCPSCGVSMVTRMKYTANTKTYLMSCLLCIFGLCCLVCLPCCMGSCMNGNHYCSSCGAFIGTYSN